MLKNDGSPFKFEITDSTLRDVSRKIFETIKPQILENHIPQGVLEEYRFKELKRLIKEHGKINCGKLDFIRPVLESIVVNLDGSFNIHFLAGIEIKVEI